ncbi:hypothetical protein ASF51_08360 [Agreia sp. Leaf283]|nr:hypothetical protein ASF51_08360 [Agreia sp. Leaf283]
MRRDLERQGALAETGHAQYGERMNSVEDFKLLARQSFHKPWDVFEASMGVPYAVRPMDWALAFAPSKIPEIATVIAAYNAWAASVIAPEWTESDFDEPWPEDRKVDICRFILERGLPPFDDSTITGPSVLKNYETLGMVRAAILAAGIVPVAEGENRPLRLLELERWENMLADRIAAGVRRS